MIERNGVFSVLACVASTGLLTLGAPARASDAGRFLGGVVTTKILGNMKRQTEAQEAQAYRRPPQPVQHAPPPPSKESQLQSLDKLAAGGYITPQEYQARRKAIIDSMQAIAWQAAGSSRHCCLAASGPDHINGQIA